MWAVDECFCYISPFYTHISYTYIHTPIHRHPGDLHEASSMNVSKSKRRTMCRFIPARSDQRSYSYAKIFVSARSLRDLNEVTPPGGRRSRKQ